MSFMNALHGLAVAVWIGGMFFAYIALRPAAVQVLEPPLRLTLWVETFKRFFPWVWIAVIALPISGYAMIFLRFDGMANSPLFVHVMNGMGTLMIFIFLHVFFAPFKRLKREVTAQNWPEAGKHLAQIRMLVGINLILGLIVIAVGTGGRYLLN